MKTILLLLLAACLMSCKKKNLDKGSAALAADRLANSGSFTEFSKNFISHFRGMANYHRALLLPQQKQAFIAVLAAAENKDAAIGLVYRNYGLNLAQLLTLKNKADNDLLLLFQQNPWLQYFEDTQIKNCILAALDRQEEKQPDRKWKCMKEIICSVSPDILGIEALRQRAKEGISAAGIATSQRLAQRAGWVGFVVTLLDYGSCACAATPSPCSL